MHETLKIFILICGISFVIMLLYLLMKRKLSERDTVFWAMGAFLILILSVAPQLLQKITQLLLIDYPPSLLFLLSLLCLMLISLYHSIKISILNERIKELTQNYCIEKFNFEKSLIENNKESGDTNVK